MYLPGLAIQLDNTLFVPEKIKNIYISRPLRDVKRLLNVTECQSVVSTVDGHSIHDEIDQTVDINLGRNPTGSNSMWKSNFYCHL